MGLSVRVRAFGEKIAERLIALVTLFPNWSIQRFNSTQLRVVNHGPTIIVKARI